MINFKKNPFEMVQADLEETKDFAINNIVSCFSNTLQLRTEYK